MDKRISAAFVTMLFLLGIVATPVSAHFTEGRHQPTYPFRSRHFDPHVEGLIGYVFPGGGLFTWPTPWFYGPGWYLGPGTNTYPGYQSPWPYYDVNTGVQLPWPAQGPMQWYQLDSNNYAPFGAILTSTIKALTPFQTMWKTNSYGTTTPLKSPSGNPTIEGLEGSGGASIEHAVKGDLLLAFNVTRTQKDTWRAAAGMGGWWAINFTMAEIMIPPEFSVGLTRTRVVNSITNNYDNIDISTRNREDYVYGPFWRRLRVYTDTCPHSMSFFNPNDDIDFGSDKMDDAPNSWLWPAPGQANPPMWYSPWKTFGNITFQLRDPWSGVDVNTDEWYYIRVNEVTAPTIAGAYTFKFRRLWSPDLYFRSIRRNPNDYSSWTGSFSFPYQNWPVVLVKGEVDPAIITGTIRYGGWNTELYGQPIILPGRVRAVGIADDPYTGKSTGRPVEARGYFDGRVYRRPATGQPFAWEDRWNGHYEVEGVAPGVYDIYASAAGYPEIKIASNVKILKGQSYHIDGYLTPGAVIKGTVFSKCGTGEVPWDWVGIPDSQAPGDPTGGGTAGVPSTGHVYNIKFEIYGDLEDARRMMPGGTTSLAVTWTPIGAGALPWDDWSFYYSTVATTPIGAANPRGNAVHRGVGPPPSVLNPNDPGWRGWRVDPALTSYTFQFGERGLYGAPADSVGHVPGLIGGVWVNGLAAGTYFVRAWLWGYVQTLADGVTFEAVSFTVPSVEWPGNFYIPFDIRRCNWVKKEVHFHDVPGTLVESPITWGWTFYGWEQSNAMPVALFDNPLFPWMQGWPGPWREDGWPPPPVPPNVPSWYVRTLAAELLDAAGARYGWSTAYVPVWLTRAHVMIRGFKEFGVYYGWGRNYGIPAGTYSAKSYMWGYVEQVSEKVTLGLCGAQIFISDHLYRGARFNITVYSQDWQFPTVPKEWRFPYMPIWIQIFDQKGTLLAPFSRQYVMPHTMQGHMNFSVAVWPYRWNNAWHMIMTHDGYGRVTALDWPTGAYRANWVTPEEPYKHDYFGPTDNLNPSFRLGSRAYDGSDDVRLVYQYFANYGEGYSVGRKPLSFESDLYSFKGLTYGYVQKKPVMMGATKGNATSDILIKLTQGAELDLTLKFKHQGVFKTPYKYRQPLFDIVAESPQPPGITGGIGFDASMRIRVYDDKKKLVGEFLTSDWWWQPQYDWRMGTACGHWNTIGGYRWTWNLVPTIPFVSGACTRSRWHNTCWRLNYIPAYVGEVRVVIAGLPDMYNWVNGYSPDPAFDMGYEGNAIAAPYGIDAAPNYKGSYTVEVDIVPLGTITPTWMQFWWLKRYYPPVGGLLMGESERQIPANHLGPYEQRYTVVVPGTHLGGESSFIFELDQRAFAEGQVLGYTYCDDWRSTSWTTVQFTAADGKIFNFYTFDGTYQAWLNAGTYTMATIFWSPAKQEGYKVFTTPFAVSDGAATQYNVFLEQSGVPIPEFPVAAIVLASALAASLFILRRKKKKQ